MFVNKSKDLRQAASLAGWASSFGIRRFDQLVLAAQLARATAATRAAVVRVA